MNNNDFFKELEEKSKNKSDMEKDKVLSQLGKEFYSTKDNNNIYQVVSIIIGVIGSIASLFLSVELDNLIILFIGISGSFVSALIMYGFGVLIKDTNKTRIAIELIYNQTKRK